MKAGHDALRYPADVARRNARCQRVYQRWPVDDRKLLHPTAMLHGSFHHLHWNVWELSFPLVSGKATLAIRRHSPAACVYMKKVLVSIHTLHTCGMVR
jgi:hypothetical protein